MRLENNEALSTANIGLVYVRGRHIDISYGECGKRVRRVTCRPRNTMRIEKLYVRATTPEAAKLRSLQNRWFVKANIVILLTTAHIGVMPALGQNAAFDGPIRSSVATVSILALSNSVSVYSAREEIYLATVSSYGRTFPLAKLVDSYLTAGYPIPRSVMIDHRQLRMVLVRNPECDSIARSFFLSSEEKNIFERSTRNELLEHNADSIPCFTVIHAATRLKK